MDNKNILIVEDNYLNLKLLSDILTLHGFSVHQAINAEEALIQLSSIKPSVILMDINLPDMDGLMLTKMIKSDPTNQKIPVIAITAFDTLEIKEKAISAGCVAYLNKPVDIFEIVQTVDSFITQKETATMDK